MTTLVSLRSQYSYDSILVGIIINLILVYLVLRSSQWLEDRIGDTGLKVMGKVFGIVLIAISIKIITNQVLAMKTGLQDSVEQIGRNVRHMDSLQLEQARRMDAMETIMADTLTGKSK